MIWRHVQTLLQLPTPSSSLISQLHCFLFKTSLDHHHYFFSNLILSAAASSPHHARKLFDTSPIAPPPLFVWNTIIRAYCSTPHAIESLKLFVGLIRASPDLRPDKFTYPFVIKACGRCSMLALGGSLHSMVIKAGFDLDSHVNNTLLTMYGECGAVDFARKVFDEMPQKNLVSWSSMISAYIDCNLDLGGLRVFKEMLKGNVEPNYVTFVSLVAACSNLLNVRLGKAMHSYLFVFGVEFHVVLGTALLNMYAKFGHLQDAYHIFNSIRNKTLQSWTVMVSCLANNGRGEEAITLFIRMEDAGLRPDSMSFSAVLSACSHGGLLDKGQEIFDKMVNNYNIDPTMEHYGCMVDLFGRAGKIKDAYRIIKSMPMEPNPVILRSYLSSCKHHGCALYADNCLMKLLLEIEPNIGSNYVLAASVSSVTGYWTDMDELRHDMKRRGLKKSPGCSWI